MTAPSLRQEIIEAMKSVAWCDTPEKRQDAIEVEAKTVMEAIREVFERQTNATLMDESLSDDRPLYCRTFNNGVLHLKANILREFGFDNKGAVK
jgi:hypothetical protein